MYYKPVQKVRLDVRSMLCHVSEMAFCHQVHLDKTVTLLDSPGIVFSTGKGDAAAALRNCLKV